MCAGRNRSWLRPAFEVRLRQLPTPNSQFPTPTSKSQLATLQGHRSDSMAPLADRLMSFVVERYPFALPAVRIALQSCNAGKDATDQHSIERLRPMLCQELSKRLGEIAAIDLPETTPGVTATARLRAARDELVEACDAFLTREAIAASLTDDERREILRGMILTRAVDNRLKQFFLSGEIKYQRGSVSGERLPVARAGSDLRRRDSLEARAAVA